MIYNNEVEMLQDNKYITINTDTWEYYYVENIVYSITNGWNEWLWIWYDYDECLWVAALKYCKKD